MPNSVAGIARRGERFFVAKREGGGDLGGKWEFPGGKREDAELDEQALVREFREEFGIEIEVGAKVASGSFAHHGRSFELNAYEIALPNRDFAPCECHTESAWLTLEEIERLDFVDSDRALLPALRKRYGG